MTGAQTRRKGHLPLWEIGSRWRWLLRGHRRSWSPGLRLGLRYSSALRRRQRQRRRQRRRLFREASSGFAILVLLVGGRGLVIHQRHLPRPPPLLVALSVVASPTFGFPPLRFRRETRLRLTASSDTPGPARSGPFPTWSGTDRTHMTKIYVAGMNL